MQRNITKSDLVTVLRSSRNENVYTENLHLTELCNQKELRRVLRISRELNSIGFEMQICELALKNSASTPGGNRTIRPHPFGLGHAHPRLRDVYLINIALYACEPKA